MYGFRTKRKLGVDAKSKTEQPLVDKSQPVFGIKLFDLFEQ